MEMTKHNTALDLSKLTEGEKIELINLTNQTNFISSIEDTWVLHLEKEIGEYESCWDGYI